MPIYEYKCECGREDEILLPLGKDLKAVNCQCGRMMMRKFSVPYPAIFRQTGKDMALSSLNGKDTAHMKPWTKQKAAEGLTSPSKTIW